MSNSFLDSEKIDLDCPQCRRKVTSTLGKLKRSPTLRCTAGHSFDVDAKELKRELDKVEKALAKFTKSLKF